MGLEVVPATLEQWGDIMRLFEGHGVRGCWCQYWRQSSSDYGRGGKGSGEARLKSQVDMGIPPGLIAYLDREPAGWCAVEPRTAYQRLGRVPWTGRDEDKDDETVWAVTCFVVRVGYRGQGLMYELARAAVDFARDRGAKAVEGYPMLLDPGQTATWGELFVGTPQAFATAGLEEVSHPTKRRLVMRLDFED